jgi:drug/metabolite transporter (DMT)-like permease
VDLLLLAVAATWGGSYLGAKELTAATTVPVALALRFLVGTGALLLVLIARRQRLPRGRALAVGALLGCTQATILLLETYGVHLTDATNAGLLISLCIVLTPLLESVAVRRWLPRSYFVATAAAVVGVALLVSGDGLRVPGPGDLLVLGAAVVRAAHVTATGRLTRDADGTSLALVGVQMGVCTVVFTLLAGTDLPAAVTGLSLGSWLDVVFLGLACSVFAFLVQLWAVRRTSAARASLLMGTEPVWAVATGVLLGGERLGLAGLAGALIIVVAITIGSRIEVRHRSLPPHQQLPGTPDPDHAGSRA